MLRKSRQLKSAELQKQIENLLAKNANQSFEISKIAKKINVANPPLSIKQALIALIESGKVISNNYGKYKWKVDSIKKQPKKSTPVENLLSGIVDMTKSGDAYIIKTSLDEDVFIPKKYTKGAQNKDEVLFSLDEGKGRRRRLTGYIEQITKRNTNSIIGTFRQYANQFIIFPEKITGITEVHVAFSDINNAKDGDRVFAKLTMWPESKNAKIWAKIIKVVDDLTEHESTMQGILFSNGFDPDVSSELESYVETISTEISLEEISKRRDLRDILTFTIDPASAKDFDDAISFHSLTDGRVEIGVHIADVSHYVVEGSILDHDAYQRSTSVYLVDRVCPMLPEKLSNNLCSLNPNEDKLTFSAIFIFNQNFEIESKWFGKTIIHSNKRFTYEEAQEIIETEEGPYVSEILTLNTIAKHLRKEKFANGAISFESSEIQFTLDDQNMPIGLYLKERKDAHLLIEDYMLLANKYTAQFMAEKDKPEVPFIYRVHDVPNPDKLQDFVKFARQLGFVFRADTPDQIKKSFNQLADEAKTNELLQILEPLAIRTMAKAEYSTNNIGHYGLGFSTYTHFTSPIRRYSDVLAHRILYHNLGNSTYRVNKEDLEAKSKHISQMEKKANDAERESNKYMQALYISKFVGVDFDGIISGMIDRGIFVELLENKIEGFVPFETMDFSYIIDSSGLQAKSRISGDVIKMGQKIRVKVQAVNIATRKVDFIIVDQE